MNIIMLHPHDIYSPAEPWSVRIVYIAREFVKKGHKVKLIYFPLVWDKEKCITEMRDGIMIIPFCRKLGPHILAANILKLTRLAVDADTIHFQKCFYHAAMPAMLAAWFRKKPLHYDWDDWELKIYEVSTQPGILRDIIRYFLQFLESSIPKIADTVSVASNRLKLECLKLGVAEERIFNAPVGADILKFSPSVTGAEIKRKYGITKPLILYLGQLHGGQYVELFIKMAAQLIKKHKKDISFMIVGDGYRAKELKGLAAGLGLGNRIIFTGAVAHDCVPEHIAAADVCVACFERNEVTICKSPLKIAEYLASGKAIVASDVGDVAAMAGDAAVLVPPGDIVAMALGVIKLLDNDSLRLGMEKVARERAEKIYNWQTTAENILNAYSQNVKRR